MKLGLVYDLRDDYLALGFSDEQSAEFDSIETIDGLDAALTRLGWRVERVGRCVELARRLSAGERFDLVFSIAEGVRGRSREAQAPAVCELFDQPYAFSDPLTMALTLDKSMAKRVVRDSGIPTADFAVMASADAPAPDFGYPMFVKPVAEGTGKGCSAASRRHDEASLRREVRRLVDRFSQAALVERYLPGREFTVGVVGEGVGAEVIGVLELLIAPAAEGGVYGYANKQSFGDHFGCRLADDAEARLAGERALAAYRALDCRDVARVDLRSDENGEPMFLEVNPIPGLKAGFSDIALLCDFTGRHYDWLIARIVSGACRRFGVTPPVRAQAA